VSQGRNFFLEWKEKRAREQAEETSFEPGQANEFVPLAEEHPEFFQWCEDRDRAINELLETTAPGTIPAVARQLHSLRQALLAGSLTSETAPRYLAEVESYINQQFAQEESKPEIDHPAMQQASEEKSRALVAWQEAAQALKDYLEKDEKVYLEVAAYATDQGCGFLSTARRILLENEPEPEDWSPPEEEEEEDD
jgi:hypothetical protein